MFLFQVLYLIVRRHREDSHHRVFLAHSTVRHCRIRIRIIVLLDKLSNSHQSPGEPSDGLLLEAEAEEGTSCLLS